MLPTTAPASPSPAVVVAAEVIAAITAQLAVLEVAATDAPHASVVVIALQQGGAIREEVGMGDTVVLQDDALIHKFEKPGNRTAYTQAAPLVGIGIETLDLTGPIDLVFDHRASGGNLFGFAGALKVGAIASHKDLRGCQRADCIDHLEQCVWPAPGDQEDRDVQNAEIKKQISIRIISTSY